ncbi:MAG: hypothetical protein IJ471_08960 [Eubacterium sp.]|nr:hypothetical protein [Eubacterium sp.]
MGKINQEDITQLNMDLFRSKLYFHLNMQADEETVIIEAQGGYDKLESACELVRDYYMERGLWTVFGEDLKSFQLETMESEFEF